MSKSSHLPVTQAVLGTEVSYCPRKVMKKLAKKKKYKELRQRFKGHTNVTHKVWCAVVFEVYRTHGTGVSTVQAEGILSLFCAGHGASVQLLSEARILALDPPS